jgi:hypothetical protein
VNILDVSRIKIFLETGVRALVLASETGVKTLVLGNRCENPDSETVGQKHFQLLE